MEDQKDADIMEIIEDFWSRHRKFWSLYQIDLTRRDTDVKKITEVHIDTTMLNNDKFFCDQCVSGDQRDGSNVVECNLYICDDDYEPICLEKFQDAVTEVNRSTVRKKSECTRSRFLEIFGCRRTSLGILATPGLSGSSGSPSPPVHIGMIT